MNSNFIGEKMMMTTTKNTKILDSSELVLVLILMVAMLFTCNAGNNLHPLILVPGSGGNQLEARIKDGYKPSSLFCRLWSPSHDLWFRLWFNPSVLISPFTQCFADRMTLRYDPVKDDYQNAPGVETRVPHFGSTQPLLYLNPYLRQITSYMAPLVESLEREGYVDGENLFGAPYDFRYGLAAEGHPSHVGTKFLQQLKELIEKASSSNGGKPVIILSHSLGGLFVLNLLNRNPISWRRRFVKHFVALSAPWGGTVQEMITFGSGYSLGVPLVNPLLVRDEQRSSESNLWLLPSPKVYGRSLPLVITSNKTYTAFDVTQFLNDIGYPQGVQPYRTRILPLTEQLGAPGVPVTCVIGTGMKTPETLFYGEDGFDKQPDVVYGDGDGTVNLLSLLVQAMTEIVQQYETIVEELYSKGILGGLSVSARAEKDLKEVLLSVLMRHEKSKCAETISKPQERDGIDLGEEENSLSEPELEEGEVKEGGDFEGEVVTDGS